MKGQLKTLTEIDKISKKSRQTIYNHVEKLKNEIDSKDLETYLVVNNDIMYLTLKGQEYIYNSMGEYNLAKKVKKIIDEEENKGKPKENQTKSNDTGAENNNTDNSTQELIKELRNQIKRQDEQLKIKDDRIDALLNIVNTQTQQLAIGSLESLKGKENNIIGATYTTDTIKNSNVEAENKKGLLQKIKELFK